ncbi:MAG TPA: 5-formyltetrahydrofolate cyclo-ligase [Chthoniobacterales bacterium]|nr:5-formyltetrahydrofolate cyclo-ligase [Chthoniobacterales bacterium]
MDQSLQQQKAALRAEVMKLVRQLTAEDRESFSDEICERVLEMTEWAEARTAVLFIPLPSEPVITPLKLDCDARKVSSANIPQSPKPDQELHLPDTIDLVLVPGVAFSRDRHRLGRGGGFFDRLLGGRGANAFKLGICFSFQIVDKIPNEPHDVILDAVVTESETITA